MKILRSCGPYKESKQTSGAKFSIAFLLAALKSTRLAKSK
jgi:hypothetical protein